MTQTPTWTATVVALATVGLLVVAIFALAHGDTAPSSPPATPAPPKHGRLDVVDVAVHNDYAQDPHLDIVLHNVGTGRAVVTRAIARVKSTLFVPTCLDQGGIGVTGHYGLRMPPAPATGKLAETTVRQQLSPDGADRFELWIRESRDAASNGQRIYQLDVSLLSDTSPRRVHLGLFMVAVPYAPHPGQGEYYWTKDLARPRVRKLLTSDFGSHLYADTMPCWRSNSVHLIRELSLQGKRSPELAQVARMVSTPPHDG